MCKHKLAFLNGDRKMLYDSSQEKLLAEVLSSAAYAVLRKQLDEYQEQLNELESEMDKIKEREKNLKSDFAYELAQGHKKGSRN